MADWDQVREYALRLPGTTEETTRERPCWKIGGKLFLWDRPLRPRDVADSGLVVDGPILAARVADLTDKDELLRTDPDVYFTIPHFDGYRAILIRLDRIEAGELAEVALDAWSCRATARQRRELAEATGAAGEPR